MSDFEVSVEDEIAQVTIERPHIVILGAGASRAALPQGDRHGNIAPLMLNLVDVVGLRLLLQERHIAYHEGNFEDLFSSLEREGRDTDLRAIEAALTGYFSRLELPMEPNLYDHLILSLRRKDLIATFNWDPLLLQAYRRLGGSSAELPRLAFLHGNVAIGYCADHRTTGLRDDACSVCGRERTPAPLLYPIAEKNYAQNEFIKNEWSLLEHGLRNAFMVTIFGYSAPRSDTEAVHIMKKAWGKNEDRSLEQIEFISVQPADELRENWGDFIHSHHYEVHQDFYESWIANHPRRTGEAYWNQYLEAKFIDDNPLPRDEGWRELRAWFDSMVIPEKAAQEGATR